MSLKLYTAPASGTISIPVDFVNSTPELTYTNNIIAGTVTLTGGLVVSPSGTPVTGQRVVITWNASVTPSGNTITIFGETVPTELAARNFVAECLWDGTGGPWVVNILPDFAGVGIVDSDRLAANSVTLAKMAQGTTGSILAYNASGDIEEVDMATDGKLLIGVTAGKGYNTAVLSGDATISTGGVLSLANNSVDTAELVDASVTTAKIDDAAVTPAKMSAGARKSSIAIPVSFETAGEIGVLKYTMCFDCTVDAIHATVTKAAATDTATAIFKDHGGTVLTGSQVDITTGLVLGNIVSTTPTANNTFTAGQQITIETSKTTPGSGNITAILCLTHN
jgi:hypothetical protein